MIIVIESDQRAMLAWSHIGTKTCSFEPLNASSSGIAVVSFVFVKHPTPYRTIPPDTPLLRRAIVPEIGTCPSEPSFNLPADVLQPPAQPADLVHSTLEMLADDPLCGGHDFGFHLVLGPRLILEVLLAARFLVGGLRRKRRGGGKSGSAFGSPRFFCGVFIDKSGD